MDEKPKLDQYSDWLIAHGRESTSIRQQIAERAISIGRFSPEQLLATFQPRGRISRAAVFRTIDEMVACGVVRRVEQDGSAPYE
jgi:Fe2+ or Zn2+ uptake regulation protein